MTKGKKIVIDGKTHLVGRLAATIAKQALEGKRIYVVRCEELCISGKQYRNRLKFMAFLRKHSNTNPSKHSHIHYRSPSMMFRRICRGMLPHKTARGAAAYKRIQTFEGVPEKLRKLHKVCVPAALKHLRVKSTQPVTRLGSLCTSVGWRYGDAVERLEGQRVQELEAYAAAKKDQAAELAAKKQAVISSAPKDIQEALALI